MFDPLARMVAERSAVRPLIGAVFAFGTVCVTHALGVAWPGPIAPLARSREPENDASAVVMPAAQTKLTESNSVNVAKARMRAFAHQRPRKRIMMSGISLGTLW